MYKVFIDNKPIVFQINPQFENESSREMVWQEIDKFINDEEILLTVNLQNESQFFDVFDNFELIEAAGGLVQRDAEYLFIKRNGFWDIPKGKLELGETAEIGAVREVEEECGISNPRIIEHLIDTWHTYEFKGKKVLKKTYWFLMAEGNKISELTPQTEEGISEVKFLKKADFNTVRSNTYNSIIDVLDKMEEL